MSDLFHNFLKYLRNNEMIKNHFVKNKNATFKELYIVFLCCVINELGITEKKTEFISKIMNGIGLSNFADYLIKAKKITNDFIKNFVLNFKEPKDIDNFLIDLLLLVNLDGDFSENHSDLINEVFRLFNIRKNKALELVTLSKYILTTELDKSEYDLYPNMLNKIKFKEKIIISTNITYDFGQIFIDCEFYFEENQKIVLKNDNYSFVNCLINSPKIEIFKANNIEFLNCKITGEANRKTNYIDIQKSDTILLKNNEFSNINNDDLTLLNIRDTQNISLNNNEFINIKITSISSSKLSHININSCENVKITENDFKFCEITGEHSSLFMIYCDSVKEIIFQNNEFEKTFCLATGNSDSKIFVSLIYFNSVRVVGFYNNIFISCYVKTIKEVSINCYFINLGGVLSGKIIRTIFKDSFCKTNSIELFCSPNVEIAN